MRLHSGKSQSENIVNTLVGGGVLPLPRDGKRWVSVLTAHPGTMTQALLKHGHYVHEVDARQA